MKGKIGAVVLALVAAQLLSGCYLLRGLDWSTNKVGPGDTSKATIELQGTGDEVNGRYFVYALLLGDGAKPKGGEFDSTEKVYNKAKDLVEDANLASVASVRASCQPPTSPIRRRGALEGYAFRTKGSVKETIKFIESTLKVRQSGSSTDTGLFGWVFTGEWEDDGDDLPEDPESTDDIIECTGISSTNLGSKGSNLRVLNALERAVGR